MESNPRALDSQSSIDYQHLQLTQWLRKESNLYSVCIRHFSSPLEDITESGWQDSNLRGVASPASKAGLLPTTDLRPDKIKNPP